MVDTLGSSMNKSLEQNQSKSLFDDINTTKKIKFSLKKSRKLDQTELIDKAAKDFEYEKCKNDYWTPKKFSLMYGTYLWDNSSDTQKIKLNQLFWVAYYSQIISAEIATIFFNQMSAASLYGIEDFRIVCDTLDLESSQERAHINAFKIVSEKFEEENFGKRIFTYPMRTPFEKTMLYSDLNYVQKIIRKWQLRIYGMISSNSPFIGCQYFTIRGLRTLNGKIIQHLLAKPYLETKDTESIVAPLKINYFHFMDESFHFNTSTIISHDVINSLPVPNYFEKNIANISIWGCQKDHYNFSTAINGIYWYDPALFIPVYKILRSNIFNMDKKEAIDTMEKVFCEENEGTILSYKTHRESVESYKKYLSELNYVNKKNKDMSLMSSNSIEKHLEANKKSFKKFKNKYYEM